VRPRGARARGAAACKAAAALALWWTLAAAAWAQDPFAQPPEPLRPTRPAASTALSEDDYRNDAARHLYATYAAQVLKGKVPAYVYAVMVTDTEVDAQGNVLSVRVVRAPSEADEVVPWVLAMVRRASPLPALLHLKGMRYVDIWLVDQSGRFQLDTLTEGQL
jgi:periplasmic protein TonB